MSVYPTHIWVGKGVGFVSSVSKSTDKPPTPQSKVKLRYMGYTYTMPVKWPKIMNTGRLLHKPSDKTPPK